MAADIPLDAQTCPTGHGDCAVMPELGHTLPAVHCSADGMLIVLQYDPAWHSVMTVDEQKKPAGHGVAALRPAVLHSWPIGHAMTAARPVDGQ